MQLIPHPRHAANAVEAIEAEVKREGLRIAIRFVVTGDLDGVVVAPPTEPRRADGLWRTTCVEAFIRGDGRAYAELNLSPSCEWAVYAFDSRRSGMRPLELAEEPHISVELRSDRLVVSASMRLPDKFGQSGAALGLSAVIEEQGGTKSYWALAHPPGDTPDFHHPDCFAVQLP